MRLASTKRQFSVREYDVQATLTSGQAFRWHEKDRVWTGVVDARWVRLRPGRHSISAEVAEPVANWRWLADYLQVKVDLRAVLAGFPNDDRMRAAVASCRGLRLLRQDPWECLASFILSSTKQIVQIRQMIALVCERYGDPIAVPPGQAPAFAFPSPLRLAHTTEVELRQCKMGFRAPYLLAAAHTVASGRLDLPRLHNLPVEVARTKLMKLPGVGPKIADCVLLFAYGFESAFPVDVWVTRALRELYFPRRPVSMARMQQFAATHLGAHAGYAQQYLFHYMRTKKTQAIRK
jgi:N-glycosylase/DNA lyase